MDTITKPSILVTDDAGFMRTVLIDIINDNELASKIYQASDGVRSVNSYKENKPDLVTMDINMPRADGVQALRAIMKINPDAKVVMVSAADQKGIVEKSIKLGAKDYIVKPFDKSQAAATIRKVLGLNSTEQNTDTIECASCGDMIRDDQTSMIHTQKWYHMTCWLDDDSIKTRSNDEQVEVLEVLG